MVDSISPVDAWEGRYQRGETGWDRNGSNPLLHTWLVESLSFDSTILIPGCGHGYELIDLARLGYKVTGIDIAPTPVEHMKCELGSEDLSAEVIQVDMFEYSPISPFDVVYEQTSLCAIQPNQRVGYEKKLYEWLKPAGKLYALFMQTGAEGGPPFHCDIMDMRALFAPSRWDWGEGEPLHSPHPSGRFELAYRLIRR